MAKRCGPRRPGRLCRPRGVLLGSLEAIVADYRLDDVTRAQEDAFWGDRYLNLAEAICRACTSTDAYGLRHQHQTRIPAEVLAAAAGQLADDLPGLQACADFEALHAAIEARIGGMEGVGPVQVYDFATRIGLRLGLAPRLVHLHAGVSKGAANLGIDIRRRSTLRLEELPPPLDGLSAAEAEDVLCIYKDDLLALPR